MLTSREAIYAALFAKLTALQPATLVTASRRWQLWSQVPANQQPACFQTQIRETSTSPVSGIGPRKWKLEAEWHLYVNVGPDMTSPASQLLNPIIDALDAALEADPKLGGLVSHCRIVGQVQTDEGVLGPQGVAIIPIDITVG